MIKHILTGLAGVLATVAAASAETPQSASINDFLTDTSGGYVGAAGIIGMDGKLVRDVSTPKELVASINAARNDDSKEGIGIAFSPGRSRFERTAIDVSRVQFMDKEGHVQNGLLMSPARRLWGSTTFSYAQNKANLDGVDYRQRAFAVNVEYYFDINDDPTFAAYLAFSGGKSCETARKASNGDASKLSDAKQQAQTKAAASRVAELSASAAAASASAAATSAQAAVNSAVPNSLAATEAVSAAIAAAKVAKDALADAQAKQRQSEADTAVDSAISACAEDATKAAKNKWNTPKATLLYGRGQIRGMGAADPRLSLGNHLQFNLAASPWYVVNGFRDDPNEQHKDLVTVSYSRATNVLDTTTIAGTPAYKSRSQFAARYTREIDDKRGSYLLAEISNAKSRDSGTDAGTYKYALGFDYKLGANMWFELRSGRSIARSGDKEETKTLMSLKFAPEPGLASLFSSP